MKRTILIVIISILVGSIVVFFPTLFTYFSQDDWVFLSHVYKRPWIDVFHYYPEAFYRPIGQQLFFFINSRLFQLNPIGYHIVALGIHAVNTILLLKILQTFKRLKYLDWLLVVFYSFHPVHLIAFNWLTQLDIEIAATFTLLTILLFERWFFLSVVTFIAALLSHETAAMLPVVLWISKGVLKGQTPPRQGLTFRSRWIALFCSVVIVLLLKYLANPFPFHSDYSLGIHPIQLFSTMKWYVLRAFFLPEGIRQLPEYVQIFSVLSFASLAATFRWRLVRGFGVFVISLLPVLFLSQHVFSVYAVIPVLLMTIGLARSSPEHRIGRMKTVLVMTLLFVTSFSISRAVIPSHWTTTRGEISRRLTEEFLNSSRSDPFVAEGSDLSMFPPGSESSFASMMGKQFEILLR